MFILVILLCAATLNAQIIVNEIHATPSAGEPEWVELWNTGPQSVTIDGWYVCDARSCVQLAISTIPAGAFAIITRDVEGLREARLVAPNAVMMEVRHPSLNNTTDNVIVRNADSVVVDSVYYRVSDKYRSLERDADGAWGPSLARDSASCGALNSRYVLQHDLRCAEITAGGPVPRLHVRVENRGRSATASVPIALYINSDVSTAMVPPLQPSAVWIWGVGIGSVDTSRPTMHCTAVITARDDRPSNDTMTAELWRPPQTGAVVITEAMMQPGEGQCDYVEVFNGSAQEIDLDGWKLVDAGRDTARCAGHVVLQPMEYGIIATDTVVRRMMAAADVKRVALVKKSFNIDTRGDVITLLNPSGFTVDVATLDADAHVAALPERKGVSLEKAHPLLIGAERTSWTSSGHLSGGTPGRSNSAAVALPDVAIGHIEASAEAPRILRFWHPFRHATVYVRVFTPQGLHIVTLIENRIVGTEGAVQWDETDSAGRRVARGPYVAVLDALDAGSASVVHAVGLVIAGD